MSEELVTCRICLDEVPREEVIAPCQCRGSQRWVHRACLDRWRATREDRAFSKCTECLFQYHLVPRFTDSAAAKRRRSINFCLLVSQDLCIAFGLTQCFVVLFTLLTIQFDSSHTMIKAFHAESGDVGKQVLFYYLFGVFLFLALAGFLGIIGAFNVSLRSPDCASCYFYPQYCYGFPPCECSACSSAECVGAGECGAECGPAALIILAILAFIGVFVSAFAGVLYVSQITTKHLHVLQKRGLAADFIVRDLGEGASEDAELGLLPMFMQQQAHDAPLSSGAGGEIELPPASAPPPPYSLAQGRVFSPLASESGHDESEPTGAGELAPADQSMLRTMGLL